MTSWRVIISFTRQSPPSNRQLFHGGHGQFGIVRVSQRCSMQSRRAAFQLSAAGSGQPIFPDLLRAVLQRFPTPFQSIEVASISQLLQMKTCRDGTVGVCSRSVKVYPESQMGATLAADEKRING